jgi:hypothetical protein
MSLFEENKINNEDDEKYNKEVRRFFEIKNKWETRKTKKQSNCLICNNLTNNMIFEISHDLYLAKCKKQTCPALEISRRTYISIEEQIKKMREKLDLLKRKFIVEKMDTMFKFIDNKNAIKVFKSEFEEYRELLKVYNKYNLENINEERENKINELNNKIYEECQEILKLRELQKTNGIHQQFQQGTTTIEDIINIVNNKITPLTDELQKIQYPIMEMNFTKKGDIKLYQYNEIVNFIRI